MYKEKVSYVFNFAFTKENNGTIFTKELRKIPIKAEITNQHSSCIHANINKIGIIASD